MTVSVLYLSHSDSRLFPYLIVKDSFVVFSILVVGDSSFGKLHCIVLQFCGIHPLILLSFLYSNGNLAFCPEKFCS